MNHHHLQRIARLAVSALNVVLIITTAAALSAALVLMVLP